MHQQGWKKLQDGRIVYVCDSGIVGGSEKICSKSGLKFEILPNMVQTYEIFNDFFRMQEVCQKVEISRALMTFASLSVMTTLFEMAGVQIKFVLGLLGTTNTLKTSTAMTFSTIFDASTKKKPDVTFSSTMSGIETYVSKYSDAILLVDDFMPAANAKKQAELDNKLEIICRLYGDRTAKKRMCDFYDRHVEYPVKGCCMFTGELLNGVPSTLTRIFVLELERGDVNKETLRYYQSHPLILPTYLYGFIMFLQKNIDAVLPYISQKVIEYRDSAGYRIARLNELQGIMFTAVDLMVEYWKNAEFISETSGILNEFHKSIQQLIIQNQLKLNQQSLSEIVIQALVEKLYKNPHVLKSVDEIKKNDGYLVYECEEFYYIRLDDLYSVTKEYTHKYDLSFTFNKNMLLKQLKECEIVETTVDEGGDVISARKLKQGKGITVRFLYIKKKMVKKIIDNQINQ